LLTAVGTRGQAPYDAVLTHGFVVDAKGRKMSKSIGNVIAPKKVINKFGAEILRLWVSAADYRDDIRISDNILKQLSDAYRRIRNTSRFILGNLYDFDPEIDAVAYDSLPDIDRFALHRLQKLIQRTRRAYETFEFHVIYHSLFNYCTLDLSAFYLDILKDRLYTAPPESRERRSAQTVIYMVLDTITRLMAPILSFTSEELWKYIPGKDKEESIHLALLPAVENKYLDEELAVRWETLLDVRGEVTRALEEARVQKLIGHPLDARITISCDGDIHEHLAIITEKLSSLFIVSQATLIKGAELEGAYVSEDIKGLSVKVESAEGAKCERCWIYDATVGEDDMHPTICRRCKDALEKIEMDI